MIALQQAADSAAQLRELAKKYGDAEFLRVMAELQLSLAEAKLECADLKMQLVVAQQKLITIEEELEEQAASEPVLKDGSYTFARVEGNFCTACWDVRNRRVRVHPTPDDFAFAGKWTCPGCKATFG